MADTETSHKPVPQDFTPAAPFNAASGGVSIALSEENLEALFGAGTQTAKPAPAPRAADVPAALAPLSATQQQEIPPVPPATPVPASATVPGRRTENVDSTLALFAAIKENRAEARKTETPVPGETLAKTPQSAPATVEAKPVSLPRPAASRPEAISTTSVAPVPSPSLAAPAAPRSRGTVFAASAHQPAHVPKWAAEPPPQPASPDGFARKVPGGWKTILAVGAVVAIGGVTAGLLTRSHGSAKPAQIAANPAPLSAASTASNFPLQLQASAEANGSIDLHWNPQSTLIEQAHEGRLVISEGTQKPRTLAVSLEQLRFGHLTYQAQSERVEFRLEVVDPSGAVAEESILTLVPQVAGKAPSAIQQPDSSAHPAAPQATNAPAAPNPTPAEDVSKPARPPARAFIPPATPLPTQLRAIEAPPAIAANSNVALPVPALAAQVPRGIAPPPPPPGASAQQVQVTDVVQAANLLKRVTPIYPPVAKTTRVQGTVRFNATIGTNGQIRNLQIVSGPAQLRQAASDAVRQWVYKPMTRNGQPVEVVTQIDVNFTLN